MKYHIDYQYLAKGSTRPSNDGEVVGIEATDESGVVVLPNVGDYVMVNIPAAEGQRSTFKGKVRTRLFSYVRTDNEMFCTVNIVVEENDDDWGKLVKE